MCERVRLPHATFSFMQSDLERLDHYCHSYGHYLYSSAMASAVVTDPQAVILDASQWTFASTPNTAIRSVRAGFDCQGPKIGGRNVRVVTAMDDLAYIPSKGNRGSEEEIAKFVGALPTIFFAATTNNNGMGQHYLQASLYADKDSRVGTFFKDLEDKALEHRVMHGGMLYGDDESWTTDAMLDPDNKGATRYWGLLGQPKEDSSVSVKPTFVADARGVENVEVCTGLQRHANGEVTLKTRPAKMEDLVGKSGACFFKFYTKGIRRSATARVASAAHKIGTVNCIVYPREVIRDLLDFDPTRNFTSGGEPPAKRSTRHKASSVMDDEED